MAMRRLPRQKYDARVQLVKLGVSEPDARTMLRAANQLHRWHELECGIEPAHPGALQAISRDDDTGKLTWYDGNKWRPYYGRDNEKLALAAIKRVMAKHPTLGYYVQGDPRGCSLYVLLPGDVPDGQPVDSYYSRGIAIYKE